MRRIFAMVMGLLTTVLLVAVLAGGVAGARAAQATHSDDGGRFFATLVPDLGPKVEPTIGGVAPGGLPWVQKSGHASLSRSGRLQAEVNGLLFGPGAPANLVGTTGPIRQVFASVVCADGTVVSANAVPFSKRGNAHLTQHITLPAQCVGPIVLIRASLDGGPWIAATGV